VEFPFPDESLRRQIWESHFPARAPLAADIDLDYLAHEFPVAGGNISNIAVGAAFLAAADGGTITTRHVLAATKREYDKLGKLWR
jgi:ATP-dependent 26S proteasome regulatory subunit